MDLWTDLATAGIDKSAESTKKSGKKDQKDIMLNDKLDIKSINDRRIDHTVRQFADAISDQTRAWWKSGKQDSWWNLYTPFW